MDIEPPKPHPPNIAAACRLQQSLVAGLTMAVLAALAAAYVARLESPPPSEGKTPILTYVAVGHGAVAIVIVMLAPGWVTNSARRRIADHARTSPTHQKLSTQDQHNRLKLQLLPVYTTRIIINAAILEGVAMIAVAAYFIDAHQLALAMALIFAFFVAIQLPTVDRIETWMDTQIQHMQSHTDP